MIYAPTRNRPPEIVPARWSGIKNAVYELHAARLGANPKTLANHKSNVRAALLWFAEEKNLPKSGVPLMPAWAALMGKVKPILKSPQRAVRPSEVLLGRENCPRGCQRGGVRQVYELPRQDYALGSQ